MTIPKAIRTASKPDLSAPGLLLDIDRFATHDGPGIRTAVFLKGCPLRCAWCHSPESRLAYPELLYQRDRCTGCWNCIPACPEDALSKGGDATRAVADLDRSRCTACGACVEVCYPSALKVAGARATVGELIEDVARALPFFRSSGGGVTLTGGEPARQFKFSYNFLLACRERGIHTALETTGYARWAVVSALADVSDLLLYDLKFVNEASHREWTGVPNRLILENLRKLAATGHEIQVRVPCITGVNDDASQIRATARVVAEAGIETIVLLPYNGAAGAKYEWIGEPYRLADTQTQSQAVMERLAAACREEGLAVGVGG